MSTQAHAAAPGAHQRIGVFAHDRSEDADQLRHILMADAAGNAGALEVEINPPAGWPGPQLDPLATIMVIVGYSPAMEARIRQPLHDCMSRHALVIVAYDPVKPYPEQAPKSLLGVNGHPWPEGQPPTALSRNLLHMIGLDEAHRRIFLSYRRGHGEGLARQLRYKLQDAGWHVFLDSFNIPPGEDFQRALFRDMDGRSLLLVIESRHTRESTWVDDEIAFATAHGIGIQALILPDTDGLVPRFPPDSCITLEPNQLREIASGDLELADHEVDPVINRLQTANTSGFRLRTADMVANVFGFLEDERLAVTRWSERVVIGRTPTTADVLSAVGRRPNLSDVRTVAEAAREAAGGGLDTRGWLVHRLTDPDPEYLRLITWAGRPHDVDVVSLMDLRRRLRQALTAGAPRNRLS